MKERANGATVAASSVSRNDDKKQPVSHEVVLLGKKYKLKSPHDGEWMQALADYVNAQVTEVQRKGSVSTLDAALLAALNIADEYHRLKRDAEERLAEIGEKTQTLVTALDEMVEPDQPVVRKADAR